MRLIRKRGQLGIVREEADRRIKLLKKQREEIGEQYRFRLRDGDVTGQPFADELAVQLQGLDAQVVDAREWYNLHLQEELEKSTKTLTNLTKVFIVLTTTLAILTVLLVLKSH